MNTKEKLTEIIGNVVVNDKGNRIRDVFHPEFVEKIVDALMVETDINVGGKGQIDSLTEIEKIIEEAFDDACYEGCEPDPYRVALKLWFRDYRTQVNGEWIRYPHNSGIYCSLCKHKRRYRDIHDAFCPNCGAKMKGE